MAPELKTLLLLSVRTNVLWPSPNDGKWMRGRSEHRLFAIALSSSHPQATYETSNPDPFSTTTLVPASGRLGEIRYPNHPEGIGAVGLSMLSGNQALEHAEGPALPSMDSIALACGVDCVGAKTVLVGTFCGRGQKSMLESELAPMLTMTAMELMAAPALQGASFISEDGFPKLIELDIHDANSVSRIASICDEMRLRSSIAEPQAHLSPKIRV